MKTLWIVATLAIIAPAFFCHAEELPSDAKSAAADANRFAVDLFARLDGGDDKNLFFSPYSIDTALAMTYGGARGQTAEQMAGALHFGLPPQKLHDAMAALADSLHPPTVGDEAPPYDLVVANALWVQKGFALRPDFLELVKRGYSAELDSLDFSSNDASREAARQTINGWVEKQTADKIKDLIAPGSLDSSTRLLLTNAIYFKSRWETQFNKRRTSDEPFHAATSADAVSMMHQTHEFGYMETADLQVVDLPYQSDRLSMIVLLPKKTDGLADLEKSFTGKALDGWLAALASQEVELSFPKFTFTSHLGLAQTLQSMGMRDAFDEHADFSGISSSGRLFIQNVIHQAFVAVDETGTEAAAATAVQIGTLAVRAPAKPVVFKADHPFVFLIRDNTSGLILFMGRVVNPKE